MARFGFSPGGGEPLAWSREGCDETQAATARRTATEGRAADGRHGPSSPEPVSLPPAGVIEERKRQASSLLECPYCKARMLKWAVPQTPFTEWDVPFMYICFNDDCPYLVRGWRAMERQGIGGFSYRAMYNPSRDAFYPVPVASLAALRDGIMP